MDWKTFVAILPSVAIAMIVSMPAAAQKGGPQGSPRYEPSAEVTVKGTVKDIKQYQSGRGWRTGQHMTLTTEAGDLDVHLGPSDFWKKNGFALTKGDALEVTGSKTKVDNTDVLLAREVKKGDKAVTLRNAQGVPAWSRGRRS
jgi:DNA/RNA endonuclease YhcR with UshA esterase domain